MKKTLGFILIVFAFILCNGCGTTKEDDGNKNLSDLDRGTLKETNRTNRLVSDDYIELVNKVIIEDKMDPKETVLYWDISENRDGKVMAYLKKNENDDFYTLYLQSNGGIIANENSSYLFFDFVALESIEGLQYLDTSQVKDMSSMFENCSSLTNLDLSNFDTGQVKDMRSMFANLSNLTSLNLSKFNNEWTYEVCSFV